MGFFSWITQDTKKSISNLFSERGALPVTMTDDKGNKYTENTYHGYGKFGRKDFYELISEMNPTLFLEVANIKSHSDTSTGQLREVGIYLYCTYPFKHKVKYPNLTESADWDWINERPAVCEYQGFFY